MSASALVEVVIQVPAAQEELAIAQLADFSPGGFRNESPVDPAAEGASAVFGVFVPIADAEKVAPFLIRAGVDVVSHHITVVPDGWDEGWKEFHQPVEVGGLWVGPPWQVDQAPEGVKRVIIEPGQGFGTGAHATTRLMLSLLATQPRASVLDVGCGSGVLAIAAVFLGFGPVIAIDNDPAAIESTNDNLACNNVESLVEVRLVDAVNDHLPKSDIVLANLTLEPLVHLAPRLHAPRVLVSGLLRSQVDTAVAVFEQESYVLRERRDRDGWAALVLDNVRDTESTMFHRDVF